MTLLRTDTTSFGLPVARIPLLQAGKTPPRDPKIHSRLGPDPEGGGGAQAWTSPPALQASDEGRADNTTGMLTCHKPLQLEEEKKGSHQMSSGEFKEEHLNTSRGQRHMWSAPSFPAARRLYLAARQSSDYF